jgi:hypothetical protein
VMVEAPAPVGLRPIALTDAEHHHARHWGTAQRSGGNMARAGYCSECGANAWLREDGSCVNGHAASCISGVYDAAQEPASAALQPGATRRSGWSKVPLALKILVGAIFLPFTILYGIYVMWKQNKFSAPARVVLTAVGALLAFAMLSSAFGQSSTAPSVVPTPESATAPAATAPTEAAIVSTETTAPSVPETEPATVVAPAPVTPPPPVAKPAPKPSPKVSVTVYTTRTGSKYHSDGCRYLKKSKIAISLSDAQSSGLSP